MSLKANVGKKQLKSMMKLKIKWLGYETPTWEPYKNMADVAKVHQYLKSNGFKKFINTIYLDPLEEGQSRKRHKKYSSWESPGHTYEVCIKHFITQFLDIVWPYDHRLHFCNS